MNEQAVKENEMWKANTTMNIQAEVLHRAESFLSDNSKYFLNSKNQISRNVLIEKALNYYMDNWEEIKKVAA